ncbi:MAG: transcription antitermination factor NusB [Anaerovoracaceae bacterium]
MTRTDAREFMMQTIFQMEAQNIYKNDKETMDKYLENHNLSGQLNYAQNIYIHICENYGTIDELINKYSQGWTTTRMPKVDLAIARLSICEMLYSDDIPSAVSINEAVDLAKKYGDEDSHKYINAILGKIAGENE